MLRKTVALICLGVLIGGGCAKKAVPITTALSTDKESSRSYGVSQLAVSPMIAGGGGGSVSAGSRAGEIGGGGGCFLRDDPM